ncbi:MAG: hypothetical protein J6A91_07285 [Bacteroidales bacterium]|nr:hypothetical protein [Bacteroidales bacterium]
MKSIFKSMVMLMLLVTGASCTGDPAGSPVEPKFMVSLENEVPAVTYPSVTLDFSFSLSYEGGLSEAYISMNGLEVEGSRTVFDGAPRTAALDFSYTVKDSEAGTTVDVVLNMIGADGAVGRWDVPVFVRAAKPDIRIVLPENTPSEFDVKKELNLEVDIVSATTDMKSVSVYKGAGLIETIESGGFDTPRSLRYMFSYTAPKYEAGTPVVFRIEVMDVNGNIVSHEFSITFVKPPLVELYEYTAVQMGMNRNMEFGQCLDLFSGTVFKMAGVGEKCADIDLVLFFSNNAATKGMSLASPHKSNLKTSYSVDNTQALGGAESDAPENWATRNVTEFIPLELTEEEYADVELKEHVYSLFPDEAESVDILQQQKKGYSFAFRTADGKRGVAYITSAPANNTGQATFNIKVEK